MQITTVGRALASGCVMLALSSVVWSSPQDQATGQTRRFGELPGWVGESWYMRRVVEEPWALTGATLVDIRSGDLLEKVNVLIQGDQIQSVGTDPLPDGIETVDVSGRFLLPGLMDLHAHVIPPSPFMPQAKDPKETLEILLDHGVTTIRALPLHSESALMWSAEVQAGHLIGPTLVTASSIFEKNAQRTSRGFADAATAERWVRKEALLGTAWIKVYNSMDEAALIAIVETAGEYGMRVCGHAEDVPPWEASELGIGTVEHSISIPLSCVPADARGQQQGSLVRRMISRWEQVDPDLAHELIEAFLVNGTGWVPTLVVSEMMLKTGVHDGQADPGFEPSDAGNLQALSKPAQLAVHMHRRGGLVGTGTDFPVDGLAAGQSLHRELELLVEYGGATPLEALQMATTGAARVLGFEEIVGRVEPDMLADIVVLSENPLENVSNVRQVELVVHQGRVHRP